MVRATIGQLLIIFILFSLSLISGLLDGKHCTLPHLTGKTFVFNAAKDRLELCVDTAGHFPVGPNVEELIQEALSDINAKSGSQSNERSPGHSLKLGGGGVVRKKERAVSVFQGKGHSLGSSSHQPVRRQHSSGVDLSTSVQGLSREELVRVAPGMVTLRDGGQGVELEPAAIETQRRRLQEMVSNLQASMDKHLRQQVESRAAEQKSEEKLDEHEEMESQGEGSSSTSEPMDQSL